MKIRRFTINLTGVQRTPADSDSWSARPVPPPSNRSSPRPARDSFSVPRRLRTSAAAFLSAARAARPVSPPVLERLSPEPLTTIDPVILAGLPSEARAALLNNSKLADFLASRGDLLTHFCWSQQTLAQLTNLSLTPASVDRLCDSNPEDVAALKATLTTLAVDTLLAQVKAWPRNGTKPPFFDRAVEGVSAALDADWQDLLLLPYPDARQQAVANLVKTSDIALAKKGHTDNVVRTCEKLLASPQFHELVPAALHAEIIEAAAYLNLCDSSPKMPLKLLAGKGDFSEIKPYLAQRGAISAKRLQAAGIAVNLSAIRHIRRHSDPSTRSLAAQFLRLANDVAAMYAKPFFKNDIEKLIDAIERNKGEGAPPQLYEAFKAFAIVPGHLDACLSSQRQDDHYVR